MKACRKFSFLIRSIYFKNSIHMQIEMTDTLERLAGRREWSLGGEERKSQRASFSGGGSKVCDERGEERRSQIVWITGSCEARGDETRHARRTYVTDRLHCRRDGDRAARRRDADTRRESHAAETHAVPSSSRKRRISRVAPSRSKLSRQPLDWREPSRNDLN